MKYLLYCSLFLVLLFGSIALFIVGYHALFYDGWSVSPAIAKKRQKIENEIAELQDHPWAGSYYQGDGLGVRLTLTLAPENGFTLTWYGCVGLYDQNHGTVDWDGDVVTLSFAFNPRNHGYATEYKPVRWGERIYLIPVDNIIGFCNAINSRDELEDRGNVMGCTGFFLRIGDEKKGATGKPELPDEFMAYLLDEPVYAAIVSIENVRDGDHKETKIATVVVDKGSEDGLLSGMELHVLASDAGYKSVMLIEVGETQSKGEFFYHYPLDARAPPPEIGWQLSTIPRWKQYLLEREDHEDEDKVKEEDHPATPVSEEAVRQIAIKKFDEVWGVDAHLQYNITVREFPDREDWTVFFDGKVPMVGNHAQVWVNKTTGATQYSPGM